MIIETLDDRSFSFDAESLDNLDLSGLNLHRALLTQNKLNNIIFKESDLRGAFFSESILLNCNFSSANLRVVHFEQCGVNQSVFDNSNMAFAMFQESIINNCTFHDTNLDGVNFTNAKILFCDFSKAIDIDKAIFGRALFNSETKWPNDFDPIRAGAIMLVDK